MRSGDPLAAARAFARATEADPQAVPLWNNLAHAHRLLEDHAAEKAALEQALSRDRLDFTAQLRLAQLLQRTGAEREAFLAWNAVSQLAAQLPELAPVVGAEVRAGQAWAEAMRQKLARMVDEAFAGGDRDWDETDRRRIGAFVDHALGRRQVYPNVCAGVHYPFLPADEFFDRRHFPWLDRVEAASATIRAELQALLAAPGELLRPYVRMEEGTPPNDWSALDGSLDWGVCFLWEYGEPNRAVLERCPQTAALLDSLPLARIPGRAPSAFFSLLRPHKRIPPHTGVTNTRAIIHLALDVPPDCGFRVGGETRAWEEGKAFAFDDTIEHEAWNDSDRLRAVLIFDTWNPHLSAHERAAITRYFAKSDAALPTGLA